MREDENKTSRRKRSNKKVVKLFPKKRVSTIYLAGAAIILAGAMIFRLATQDEESTANKQKVEQGVADHDGTIDSLPVTKMTEEIKMPVLDEKAVSITKHFYDENASEEEQQEALIHYNNQYTKNTGIDIATEDGNAFEVTAALGGTVIDVKEDALLGNIVEIQHDNELKTVYQSLNDVQVELGQTVAQGEVIGKAGQSVIGKDLGIHVHFEIRNDGVAVNPESAFDKTIATLKEDIEKAAAEPSKVEENTTDSQPATNEEKAKTDEQSTVEDEVKTEDQSSVEDEAKTEDQSSVEDETKADDQETDSSATEDSSADDSTETTDGPSSTEE